MVRVEDIPIYCINLPARTERWEKIRRRFSDYPDLHVNRWLAFGPTQLGTYTYGKGGGCPIGPGLRACARSHFELWVYMVERELPYMFILEDDAVFRKDWREILQAKLDTIEAEDPEWDCLLLNALDGVDPHETWVRTKENYLAGGYILSLRAAKWLMTWKDNLFGSDWMTWCLQYRGHTYTYFPWLIIQENIFSDIRGHVPTEQSERVDSLLEKANYSKDNYRF
jgi:GR25 family glycosyltransferase involved in LPS biosynthesis